MDPRLADRTLIGELVVAYSYLLTPEGWRIASRREETLLITGGRFAEIVTASLTGKP